MKVLGIDSILHNICAAVTEDNNVLSNEIRSIPMSLANQSLLSLTKFHIEEVGEVIDKALEKASVRIDDISLIAVNNLGSLLSNVLIGLAAANTLSAVKNIPIVSATHQEGHIFSNWIERNPADFSFPILVFSASGGHSLTVLISENSLEFHTISDSSGIKRSSKPLTEFVGIGFLFSQIVLILGLSEAKDERISDGEFIEQLAKTGSADEVILISRKWEDRYFLELNLNRLMKSIYGIVKREKRWGRRLSEKFIVNIVASFQKSLAEIIANYLYWLAQKHKAKEIHLAGGISANDVIRNEITARAEKKSIIARYPVKKSYCTDNAVMIAALGYYKFMREPERYTKQRHLGIVSDLVLERVAVDQFIKKHRILD